MAADPIADGGGYPGHWSGRFVWYGDERYPFHRFLMARRAFRLPAAPRRARLAITAEDRYVLYVNGTYLGRGPARSDPRWKSYDTYDVAAALQPGRNAIAVLAYHYGCQNNYSRDARAGLFVQLDAEAGDGTRTTMGTDGHVAGAPGTGLAARRRPGQRHRGRDRGVRRARRSAGLVRDRLRRRRLGAGAGDRRADGVVGVPGAAADADAAGESTSTPPAWSSRARSSSCRAWRPTSRSPNGSRWSRTCGCSTPASTGAGNALAPGGEPAVLQRCSYRPGDDPRQGGALALSHLRLRPAGVRLSAAAPGRAGRRRGGDDLRPGAGGRAHHADGQPAPLRRPLPDARRRPSLADLRVQAVPLPAGRGARHRRARPAARGRRARIPLPRRAHRQLRLLRPRAQRALAGVDRHRRPAHGGRAGVRRRARAALLARRGRPGTVRGVGGVRRRRAHRLAPAADGARAARRRPAARLVSRHGGTLPRRADRRPAHRHGVR